MTKNQPNFDFDELPDSAFVRMPTVSMLCGGTDRATLYKWVKAGKFPAPRKISVQTTAWNVGELRRHFAGLERSYRVEDGEPK